MNKTARLKPTRRSFILGLTLAMVALAFIAYNVIQVAADGPVAAPATGIVCTENASSTFTLTAKEGYISMADGNQIYMWGLAEGRDDFQYPGPVLCVNQHDTVTIVLHNTLIEDTSLVFPGQVDVLANGGPMEPQFDGQGNLTSLTEVATANGGSVTYKFVVNEPGTYIYQSGTNPGIQTQMGLWGALVVRPSMGPDYAYNDATTQFNADSEYMMMLSEIDPLLHQAIERGESFNMNDYNARYFLINGRTFPDTLAPNNANWLPGQPYSSLSHIYPYHPVDYPLPALDRFIGMGVEGYPFHPHAFNAQIIARDGRLLQTPLGQDLYEERFSLPINPGQTSDALYAWTDTYKWNPDAAPGDADEFPVEIPNQQNLPPGLFYGSPFLGNQDVVPVAGHSFNQCGEFYHIAHNHNLQQITGWGVVLIGQITFTRIDPPLPNNCP